MSKDETPEGNTVAAVIVRATVDDKPALGIGIVHNKMAWCTEDAEGHSKNITALQVDETSGYMDGSDGWDLLVNACEDLKNATSDTIETVAQNYYPAWNYSLTYAETNGLTGDLEEGWYLPTMAELYTIYQNKAVVDASLSKAGGSTFGTSKYWSCCVNHSINYLARGLDFDNGDMNSLYDKYYTFLSVCSVRAFN